jgi:hypothetical protein
MPDTNGILPAAHALLYGGDADARAHTDAVIQRVADLNAYAERDDDPGAYAKRDAKRVADA